MNVFAGYYHEPDAPPPPKLPPPPLYPPPLPKPSVAVRRCSEPTFDVMMMMVFLKLILRPVAPESGWLIEEFR